MLPVWKGSISVVTDHPVRGFGDSCTGRRQDRRALLLHRRTRRFEGSFEDHQNLTDSLKGISACPNVKICASSRPWPILQDSFGKNPSLFLQYLDSYCTPKAPYPNWTMQ